MRALTRHSRMTAREALRLLHRVWVLSGCLLLLAMPVLQQHLGNTVFSTAHLHLTMTALLGLAFVAGLHDVWPRLTGRAFSEVAGKAAAGATVNVVMK